MSFKRSVFLGSLFGAEPENTHTTVSDIANKAIFIQVPITIHFYSRADSDLIPNHVQIFISARKFILFLEAVFIVILIRTTTITGPY